jgi:hypothetical protein
VLFAVYVYVDASDENEDFPEEVRSKYIITRELGAGACGKVYLVFEKVSARTFRSSTVLGTHAKCEASSTQFICIILQKSCDRYAMKVVQKTRFDGVPRQNGSNSDRILNEGNILTALKHVSYTPDMQRCSSLPHNVCYMEANEDTVCSLASFE